MRSIPAPQAEMSPRYCFMAGLFHPPKARKSEKEALPSSGESEYNNKMLERRLERQYSKQKPKSKILSLNSE